MHIDCSVLPRQAQDTHGKLFHGFSMGTKRGRTVSEVEHGNLLVFHDDTAQSRAHADMVHVRCIRESAHPGDGSWCPYKVTPQES